MKTIVNEFRLHLYPQVMADAMQKSKTSLQAAPAITGPPPAQAQADYSPATVVAANKFKRFLGRHLAGSPVPGNQGKPISISQGFIENPYQPYQLYPWQVARPLAAVLTITTRWAGAGA